MTVTFVIPVGPAHIELAQRAIASVERQTLKSHHIVVFDQEGMGPGWSRNLGLSLVDTEFVSFLDADDWIEPDFAKLTTEAFDGDRYIYTDWYQYGDGNSASRIIAPPCPWYRGTWHPITSLIPTEWALKIKGFDIFLEGGEDTYFYSKLIYNGLCGRRLPYSLFHYSDLGQRSRKFHDSEALNRFNERLRQEIGSKRMSCCGDNNGIEIPPPEGREDGDVLAVALWAGNRREVGRITGRLYPRTGNKSKVWVNPRDAEAAPHLWQVIAHETLPTEWSPDFERGVIEIFGSDALPNSVPSVLPVEPNESVKPNVAKLSRLAARALNPEMSLTKGELNALQQGHKVRVEADGRVIIDREFLPDIVIRKGEGDE